MIKAYLEIEEHLLDQLEEILYETAPHNWILYFNHSKNCTKLEGYFKDYNEAKEDFSKIVQTLNLKHVPGYVVCMYVLHVCGDGKCRCPSTICDHMPPKN